jgi:hypothetical protein
MAGYLRLRPFDDAEVTQLEQFLFEEACRLEQTAALTGRAREFLKEQRVLEPAEFRIARIVGEQRARAREHIFRRITASVPNGLEDTLEDLLVVKPDETSSGLQAIKANPLAGSIILDDAISDEELRAQLFAVVSREELVACMDKIGEWVSGKRSDLFHGIVRRHGMLRKFSPALLDALEFPGHRGRTERVLACVADAQGIERDRTPQAAGRCADRLPTSTP